MRAALSKGLCLFCYAKLSIKVFEYDYWSKIDPVAVGNAVLRPFDIVVKYLIS